MVKKQRRRKPPQWMVKAAEAAMIRRFGPRSAKKPKPISYATLFAQAKAAVANLPPWEGSADEQEHLAGGWREALVWYELIADQLRDKKMLTADAPLRALIQQAGKVINDGDWREADVTMLDLEARLRAYVMTGSLPPRRTATLTNALYVLITELLHQRWPPPWPRLPRPGQTPPGHGGEGRTGARGGIPRSRRS